jgi:hypothetical protein
MMQLSTPVGQPQDDLRAPREIRAATAGAGQRLQRFSLFHRQEDHRLKRLWHAPQYHITNV